MNPAMSRNRFGALQIGIILLALATAAIHLFLALTSPIPLPMFILNGIGYLALVTALYLPQLRRYQSIIRWILIIYTAFTVIAWVFLGARSAVGYIDKVIEIALIVLLFIEGRR
jgi:hypothetical protein